MSLADKVSAAVIRGKADALSTAWSRRYDGERVGRNAMLLLLSVADLETEIGEYRGVKGLQLLPGPSHNWGQIQRRTVTPEEKASIQAGSIPPARDDSEFLSGDTSPDTGAYHVWLWRFPDDVQGADKLLSVIVDGEKLRARLDAMTPTELAQSMYDAHYYEGSHSRKEEGGPAKNVAAYSVAISTHYAKLDRAMQEGVDGPTSPVIPVASVSPSNPHKQGLIAAGIVAVGVAFLRACLNRH